MNHEINEVLSAKSNGKPGLISAPAKELLNLRRLPTMLNAAQTAALIGLAEHDIPVLVSARLLEPLGNPPANAVKHFATMQVLELAGEITQLSKIRNAVYEHWRTKNANKGAAESKPRHHRNGHH
jgi:hypothetical protein